jgi:hypothetical protein
LAGRLARAGAVWLGTVAAWGASPPTPLFEEVSGQARVQFTHVSGAMPLRHVAETMGSGGGFLDYDNDGWLDIYLVNGGRRPGATLGAPASNRLYHNNGDGTFTDVTARAGVGGKGYGMGCAFADYDNDGFVDIYVTNVGPNVLYHNNGDGTFTDVTARAGVGDAHFSTSAVWGDYDRDGFLDLYVCNYVRFSKEKHQRCTFKDVPVYCYPHSYDGQPNTLYHNNRDGTFTDVTERAGVREPDLRASKSLGALWFDMDGDGDLDLYVANDTTPNYLFENRGNGSFADVSLVSGAAFGETGVAKAGMGVDAADLDGSGRQSLIVTNFSFETNSLFWNEGGGTFSDRSVETGLAGPSFVPLGFGVNFLDYDNDGRVDLFVANGHVFDNAPLINPGTEYRQSNQLFRNTGGRFVETSAVAGPCFARKEVGRGSAAGDFDNDGRVDLLVVNNNGPALLLRNVAPARSWLTLKLAGTHCNRDAVGARVTLQAGDRRLTQEIRSGSSYMSQSDLRLHFGLGDRERPDSIQVVWPCGKKQEVPPPARPNQFLTVKEP